MGVRAGAFLRLVLLLSAGAQTGSHSGARALNRTKEEPNPQLLRSEQLEQHQLEQHQPALNPRQLQPKPSPSVRAHGLVQSPDLNPIKQEPKVLVRFEQRVPVPAHTVAVRCGEAEVTIEVKQNFLGNGQLIRAGDLTLGGCRASHTQEEEEEEEKLLLIQARLQDCNSTVQVSKEALVYSFSLLYAPSPSGPAPVLKTNRAQVSIQCHYPRRHYVSSDALWPSWRPLGSNVLVEQQLDFTLRLMTEGWQSARPSSVYFLGDVMHVEAAVLRAHHVPLRVYVDQCVATAQADPGAEPGYTFINNHGCLTDAKLSGAKSFFMQRSQEEKLHFQLQTFMFHRENRSSIFITCRLKATSVSAPVDLQHKACSFLTEAQRWVASDGDNKVCVCCDSSCSSSSRRKRRRRSSRHGDAALEWEGTAALGPIVLRKMSDPPHPHRRGKNPGALAVVLLVSVGDVVGSSKASAHCVCT
ncbi:zona pellucida sperm-binding protein 3-like [Genypterus blacodes]|uniref:zona pellucida sperm-binding protein 3-like n=1 Tax=Genypterus blacodes TaxID=154954 RepID=UPI003F763270